MEKYGFVYLWYDKKRKMFYIGSHWGTESDGYICSSNRMRNAYKRRPQDFKKRVIQRNITRDKLLDEEHKWLQMISEAELGIKYYNLRQHKWGHWSTDMNQNLTIREKIKKTLSSPEVREKIAVPHRGKIVSEETRKKIRTARAKQVYTEETKRKMSKSKNGTNNPFYGKKHSEETKQRMRHSALNRKKKGTIFC